MYKGKKNIYICNEGHKTVTVDRDKGTTAFLIACPECPPPKTARSSMYRVDQSLEPTHEWYNPTEEDLRDLKSDMALEIFTNIKAYVERGGLLFRPIRKEKINE